MTTDGQGEVDFTASISTAIDESAYLTATATDNTTGSTSEFSRCLPAGFTVLEGGELITSEPVAVSPSGGPGFTLEADQLTLVSLCSVSTIRMTAGDQITVGCGSAIFEVVVGPIEIQLDDNTEAIVPPNAIVTVEEVEEGQIKLQNDSPEGSEPVQIAVGGEVVSEIGAGETILQATVAVATAEVSLADGDEDEFEIEGTLAFGSTNNGIDVLNEDVTVVLGTFTERIPAGSFVREDDDGAFEFEHDDDADDGEGGNGITDMEIRDDGTFQVDAENVDLSGLDLSVPVPFALRVGDDLGSVAIPFDEDGEFQGAASVGAVLAGAFDVRLGPESLTVAPLQAATFTVSLGARGVFAGKTVSLSCTDLPVGASCTFAPPTLTPDEGGASSVLTVTTDGSGVVLYKTSRQAELPIGLGLVALVLGGLALGRSNGGRRRRTVLSLGYLLLILGFYTACTDEVLTPSRMQPTPPGTHVFKVIATAGAEERALAVTLTVGAPEAASEDGGMRGTIR